MLLAGLTEESGWIRSSFNLTYRVPWEKLIQGVRGVYPYIEDAEAVSYTHLRQVQDAHQVRIHIGQLLERPLLAPTVLEDTSGLFDETATLLRRGRQNRVELPLADDDVHLAAHARVGQELLHVQQPRRSTVDGVFGAAPAKRLRA